MKERTKFTKRSNKGMSRKKQLARESQSGEYIVEARRDRRGKVFVAAKPLDQPPILDLTQMTTLIRMPPLEILPVIKEFNLNQGRIFVSGAATETSQTRTDHYDSFGDAIHETFKDAARKARLRALEHDGYTTIKDGKRVIVRSAETA